MLGSFERLTKKEKDEELLEWLENVQNKFRELIDRIGINDVGVDEIEGIRVSQNISPDNHAIEVLARLLVSKAAYESSVPDSQDVARYFADYFGDSIKHEYFGSIQDLILYLIGEEQLAVQGFLEIEVLRGSLNQIDSVGGLETLPLTALKEKGLKPRLINILKRKSPLSTLSQLANMWRNDGERAVFLSSGGVGEKHKLAIDRLVLLYEARLSELLEALPTLQGDGIDYFGFDES
jgi:hypothetical protein